MTAAAFATVLAIAVLHTLVAPFGADVVGEGLGELGDVGGDVVFADAGICEGFL